MALELEPPKGDTENEGLRRMDHFRLASAELGVLGHHGGFGEIKALTIVIGSSSSALQTRSNANKMRIDAACTGWFPLTASTGLANPFDGLGRLGSVRFFGFGASADCHFGCPVGFLCLIFIARLYSPMVKDSPLLFVQNASPADPDDLLAVLLAALRWGSCSGICWRWMAVEHVLEAEGMRLRANPRRSDESGKTRLLRANPRRSDSVRDVRVGDTAAGYTRPAPSQVPALYLPCSGCKPGARAGRGSSGQIELSKRSNTARRSPASLPQLSKEHMVSFTDAHDTMDSRDLVRSARHPERGPDP